MSDSDFHSKKSKSENDDAIPMMNANNARGHDSMALLLNTIIISQDFSSMLFVCLSCSSCLPPPTFIPVSSGSLFHSINVQ